MSEITNIPLGGVSNEPNNYGTEDGALSLSLNAVKHHGSIRPVMPGSPVKDIGELPANTDVVAIHEVGDMKHYILLEEIEKPAGARSTSTTITLHYLCLPDKVRIWWSSNNPDKFAGPAEMLIGIGIEGARDYSEISVPYGEQKEYDIPNLTIRYDETGDIGYEFYDRARHLTDELIVPKLVTYSGKDTPPDQAENLDITIKNEFTTPVINITCVNMPEQVMLSCNISKIPEMPVHSVLVWMCGREYELKEGERKIVPAEDITIDATVSPMKKYAYPDVVIEEGLLVAEKLYATSIIEYSDFMGETGVTDYYTVNYTFEGAEDSEGSGGDGSGSDGGTEDDGNGGTEDDTEDEIADPVCRLLYIDSQSADKTPIRIAEFAEHVTSVSTIGNVLTIILNGQPLFYIIWRDNKYQVLGSKLPELECGAYIDTRVLTAGGLTNTLGVTFDESKLGIYDSEKPELSGSILSSAANNMAYTSEMKNFAYNKVFSVVNSAHHAMEKQGYFYAPFYVRMAYRMFDGTHVMHTPPKLMMVNSAGHPFFKLKESADPENTSVRFATLAPYFPCAKLNVDIAAVDNKWKDLITDVDIFVTPPIINYSDSAESIVGTRSITRDYAIAQQNKETTRSVLDFTIDSDQNVVVSDIVAYKDVWYNMPANLLAADSSYVIPEYDYDFDIEQYSGNKLTWNKEAIIAYQDEKAIKLGDLALPSWLKGKLDRGLSVTVYRSASATKYEYNSVTAHVAYIGVFLNVQFVPLFDFNTGSARSLVFQRADGTSYEENLVEENRFFRIKSIPLAEVEKGWSGEIAARELSLDTLEQQEALADNGQSRSSVIPGIKPVNYNTRLSVVVGRYGLPVTSNMEYFVSPPWKESTALGDFTKEDSTKEQTRKIISAWIRALVNSQTIYSKIPAGNSAYADGLRQFYYPDYNATQLILLVANTSSEISYNYSVMVYNLKKHKLLNGAYLFDDFKVVQPSATKNYNTREDANKDADIKNAMSGKTGASYGNMVRVSNVANPFYFNEVNQVTLPTGTISGLSTTAKALSQGQFGAFPLYCFSDNGIWALEVSDTGTYSAKQPVSRAVCTNPDSITQTEGSVLFVTKRGLMALDGSNVTCVSEILSGHNYTSALSKLYEVKKLAGLQDVPNPDTHIEEWLQDARLLYDDKRQMIYAFNGENVLGYVYSISDQAWGMMVHDLAHPLSCYTDALAVTREGEEGKRKLVNMSDHTMCGAAPKAVLVTRPLTFGSADAYKSIEALTLRGVLDKDDAKLVIWASNDLKHWAVVASSQTSWYRGKSGTPYKYYRIGIVLDWEEEDSLNAIGADITTRLTNRIR